VPAAGRWRDANYRVDKSVHLFRASTALTAAATEPGIPQIASARRAIRDSFRIAIAADHCLASRGIRLYWHAGMIGAEILGVQDFGTTPAGVSLSTVCGKACASFCARSCGLSPNFAAISATVLLPRAWRICSAVML
jgi:hypothetical protein